MTKLLGHSRMTGNNRFVHSVLIIKGYLYVGCSKLTKGIVRRVLKQVDKGEVAYVRTLSLRAVEKHKGLIRYEFCLQPNLIYIPRKLEQAIRRWAKSKPRKRT